MLSLELGKPHSTWNRALAEAYLAENNMNINANPYLAANNNNINNGNNNH